ncbi:hypothetical protein B6N42_11555 [Cutibacterium avidum]|nr:hypothetical protein B6N42_11555 [Cutibacterium avidum]
MGVVVENLCDDGRGLRAWDVTLVGVDSEAENLVPIAQGSLSVVALSTTDVGRQLQRVVLGECIRDPLHEHRVGGVGGGDALDVVHASTHRTNRLLAEQTKFGDRLLTLHIAGKRLHIRLNQPVCHKLRTPALIESLPRLPIHQVSAKRLAITLYLRQILRRFGHHLPGKHRPLTHITTSEIKRFLKRIMQPRSRRSLGELVIQSIRLRTSSRVSSSVGAVFVHGLPPRCKINVVSVLESVGGRSD